jgi:hypothetical protein
MTRALQTASDASLRERFQRLAAEWKEQSRYLSNTAQMATLRPYQISGSSAWVLQPSP